MGSVNRITVTERIKAKITSVSTCFIYSKSNEDGVQGQLSTQAWSLTLT